MKIFGERNNSVVFIWEFRKKELRVKFQIYSIERNVVPLPEVG